MQLKSELDPVGESEKAQPEENHEIINDSDKNHLDAKQEEIKRNSVVLNHGRGGLLGIKAGMTQIFNEQGECFGVTVIDLKPTIITQLKTVQKNGYQAVQVGFLEKKKKAATKPEQGHAKKAHAAGFYHYQEFRITNEEKMTDLKIGDVLSPEFLKIGDLVDLTARSKGKGFQGGMKRYHMAGGNKSHGASVCHRQLGSIGNRADPAKCFKNKKMAGQMGNESVTVQNVRVVGIDLENQLLLVNGSVPGSQSGIVSIRKALKTMRSYHKKYHKVVENVKHTA